MITPAAPASAPPGLELLAHLDLAGESRVRLNVEGEIEHVLLHRRGLAGLLLPSLVDVDVTGRARAGAAAFGLDLRHTVLDRRLHDGRADLAVDGPRSAAGIDVGDFDHEG